MKQPNTKTWNYRRTRSSPLLGKQIQFLALLAFFILQDVKIAQHPSNYNKILAHAFEIQKDSKNDTQKTKEQDESCQESDSESIPDEIDDSFYHPLHSDPSCHTEQEECWHPPSTTVETEAVKIDATAIYGGDDPSQTSSTNEEQDTTIIMDKHWGRDPTVLKMRDKLRNMGRGEQSSQNPHENKRPPIFLLPGLASTRLVSWKFKACSNPLLSDVKVQDYVWMNINMLLQMATLDDSCFLECMTLGLNQTDANDQDVGCKLRPDEGLDAISSLAPNTIASNTLVGGTNTVYAWLTQWLADNLGYDVTSIIGLPYDWRLSPDVMEARDGFLTLTRRRIEAAVKSNGEPGIMVAHSMGNIVFRYFLEWLKNEMHEEAYQRLVKQAERREMAMKLQQAKDKVSNSPSVGWINTQTVADTTEAAVEYSVADQMYKLANSFVESIDDMWNSYVTGLEKDDVTSKKDERSDDESNNTTPDSDKGKRKHPKLWELAQVEGDDEWLEWIDNHIWTYVGLSAPLLGAINPLRAVISGENMGLPMSEKNARTMELSFGSTHTLNPISTSTGFCDNLDTAAGSKSNLACLDELIEGIEKTGGEDPWRDFPALKALLKNRVDWDTDFEPIGVEFEECNPSAKPPCKTKGETAFKPKDVQNGEIFDAFNSLWKEKDEPLKTKREQLQKSWWESPFPNLLNSTWDRPHIKHVIMSYGVDHPTEVGYVYKKTDIIEENEVDKQYDDVPLLKSVIWEEPESYHFEEIKVMEQKSLKDSVMLKKKPKRRPLNQGNNKGSLHRSGDASVPYLSLSWSHTWLLHATRAMRHSRYFGLKEGDRISDDNALNSIKVSYRPVGGSDWIEGGKPKESRDDMYNEEDDEETGVEHPHGTKYKPEMYRYQSEGKSRTTGMEYTTAVIEAVGVEHKETTRNYDILAAVFTDVLKHMHNDFGLV